SSYSRSKSKLPCQPGSTIAGLCGYCTRTSTQSPLLKRPGASHVIVVPLTSYGHSSGYVAKLSGGLSAGNSTAIVEFSTGKGRSAGIATHHNWSPLSYERSAPLTV